MALAMAQVPWTLLVPSFQSLAFGLVALALGLGSLALWYVGKILHHPGRTDLGFLLFVFYKFLLDIGQGQRHRPDIGQGDGT